MTSTRRIIIALGAALLVGGWAARRAADHIFPRRWSAEAPPAVTIDNWTRDRVFKMRVQAAGVVSIVLGAGVVAFAVIKTKNEGGTS